ncbi:MAG: phage tail protein [Alphaproteobacteria bacterium]|nr:phage tail protein [Alphaproteobacteria bacterium]
MPLDSVNPAAGATLGGVVFARVTDNKDPEGLNRVQVSFPWIDASQLSAWARVVTPMAGPARGFYALPEVDDEVLVAFEMGRPDRAVVLGAVWSKAQAAPYAPTSDANPIRAFVSPAGHRLVFDDTADAEKIIIQTADGTNKIEIDASTPAMSIAVAGDLTITSDGAVTLSAPNGDVAIDCANFKVTATGDVTLEASGALNAAAQTGMALDCTPGIKLNNTGLEVK